MTGKRGAAYYRARLRRDHPTIFADLSSGKFVSVREAAAAAGLIRLPTRLDALEREWTGATEPQRIAFLKWVKAWDLARKSGTPVRSIARPNGQLTLSALAFLKNWIRMNRSKAGWIMKEMGFSVYDTAVAYILLVNAAPRKEVLEKLKTWFASKGYR
jgi:hypothetical protein